MAMVRCDCSGKLLSQQSRYRFEADEAAMSLQLSNLTNVLANKLI